MDCQRSGGKSCRYGLNWQKNASESFKVSISRQSVSKFLKSKGITRKSTKTFAVT
jgi:hypothetical protein